MSFSISCSRARRTGSPMARAASYEACDGFTTKSVRLITSSDRMMVTMTVGVMVKTLQTSTRRMCRREPAAPRLRSSQSWVRRTATTETRAFSLDEVVARIRAVLRRTRGETDDQTVLRFEDLELDEDAHEVRRGHRIIETSPTEFNLLRYLMLNPNRVLSKAQILDHVWDYDFRGESGIVESYISYLRRKIDTEGLQPLIHTKRGVGYVLKLPPQG